MGLFPERPLPKVVENGGCSLPSPLWGGVGGGGLIT
jgi:hypothetical protein